MIDAQRVLANGVIADKASRLVDVGENLRVLGEPPRYVSRGGEKLAEALRQFAIDPRGVSALDVGASTGGFTDCLLQHGAARVFAVDVGRNQLHERIAGDARVTWREGTNIRDVEPADLPFVCSLLVADLSFISLVTVLPALSRLVTGDGALPAEMVLLVKPQFEVGREEASRGRGVITDPVLHRASVDKVAGAAVALGWSVEGEMESPLKGQDGNTEFLLHLRDAGRS